MALKLRKDIKKSSYYVWFLGAKESKGLRGSEYILPVIKHLEEREKDVEPFKVTLQVSHKGLKIIQNVLSQGVKNNKPKNETIKHFIPHNTITCVYQHEDIIACILLLFNPVTKCPLHVHAYRCDSLETATLLKQQLQTLIERPENQKKFAEIENRLKPPKEVKKVDSSSLGSDTGTSTRESESSEERFAVENTRVTTLYDSVAAELREKLGKNNVPILLPPRDYDTVHRQKGNLTGIELRRCLNSNIVGQNVKGRRIESSGGSSGIGSDHPPSPDSPDAPDTRFNTLDNHSTSDEDWNGVIAESTLYLMHGSSQVSLPRPNKNPEREKSPECTRPSYMAPESRISRYAEPVSSKYTENTLKEESYSFKEREKSSDITKYLEKPIAKYSDNKYLERQKSLEREKHLEKQAIFERSDTFERGKRILERQKSVDLPDKYLERQISLDRSQDKYYEKSEIQKSDNRTGNNRYYIDNRDKYDKYPEAERYDKYDRKYIKEEQRRIEKEKPVKYFEDDGFDEKIRRRNKSPDLERKYSYDSDQYQEEKYKNYKDYPVPKTRQKYSTEDEKYYEDKKNKYWESPPKYYHENNKQRHEAEIYYDEEVKPRPKSAHDKYSNFEREHSFDRYEEMMRSTNDKYNEHNEDRYYDEDIKMQPKSAAEKYRDERNQTEDEFLEESVRRPAKYRQRSPSTDDVNSPQDRFKDAKEKFLLMEKERLEEQRRNRIEVPISPIVHREKSFLKRHESMMYPVTKDRYDERYFEEKHQSQNHPKPAPRHVKEEVRYRRDVPLERYRNTDKYDPKRRSMFSLIEEEHRKNSNEIAKELKRRSYMETTNYDREEDYRDKSYQDLPESDRYPPEIHDRYGNYSKSSLELDTPSDKFDQKLIKNQQKISKNSAGFRHSYAESPKMRTSDKNGNKKHYPDMLLQRTNSSVSNNNGRVGIASIHPY